MDPRTQFGDIDIYLFDQLLRARVSKPAKVVDAGCGGGRNLVYLMREGFDLWAIDSDDRAIESLRQQARTLAPHLPPNRFTVQPVERMSFPSAAFDIVISSAVLHFARDEAHWWAMVHEMGRVLATDGLLFARLASTIGIETQVSPLGDRRFVLPDGSTRFLVDESMLLRATEELGG